MDADCLFCRIVAGEVPATVVEDADRTLAFRDVDPQAPIHVLVVPKEHHVDVAALSAADPSLLAELHARAVAIAGQEELAGFRLVLNTGAIAGQSVFHVHLHLLGGRSFGWPPG